MNILLVEDDENKRREVGELLRRAVDDLQLTEAKSLHSGLTALRGREWDLVIRDMTMPTFDIGTEEDGGRPQAYGGRELLGQMARRGIVAPVIVLTQFDRFGQGLDEMTLEELNRELMRSHGPSYLGSVYYNPAYDTWREDLLKVVEAVKGEKES
jgi:CheY-like chemotaxis protein